MTQMWCHRCNAPAATVSGAPRCYASGNLVETDLEGEGRGSCLPRRRYPQGRADGMQYGAPFRAVAIEFIRRTRREYRRSNAGRHQ